MVEVINQINTGGKEICGERKKPEKATKKEPWLDGPKALVISTVITASVELIKHFLK
ncbi:hypothetical protein U750_11420 [Streptococcus pseudopneumoniae G42]|nr:hypothetical protein U750_11420 [Streptococcus pseudopneumoniae G42]